MKKLLFGVIIALVSLTSCASDDYLKYADTQNLWSLTYETCDETHIEKCYTFDKKMEPVVTKNGKAITHTFSGVDGKNIEVSFTYTPYNKGKGVQISSKVVNNESGVFVKKVTGPIFSSTDIKLLDGKVYLPAAAGMVFEGAPCLKDEDGNYAPNVGYWEWNKKRKCYEYSGTYPSHKMSIQYWVFEGKEAGLYVASHDPKYSFKRFILRHFPETEEFQYGIEQLMTVFEGQTYDSPATIIAPISADWHDGADIYSKWYHANIEPVKAPEWMNNSTAWVLTIMKQQNAELMWDYKSIGEEMTKVAKDRGYNMLGLFGWTLGGHDRWYPEYKVDDAMGGVEGLKAGIAKAKEQGMRVIIYVNGQLIDTEGTEFWPAYGDSIVVRKKDGSDYHQMWQKYKDCPARHHGMACQSTALWKEVLLDLAKQANSYGADGIIFDQLGTTNVTFCYAANHGHTVPAIVYENDKYENLKYVQEQMSAINPEFIVITEGICEAEINSVSMFHLSAGSYGKNQFNNPEKLENYINGSAAGTYFGQMFKYTIPEWVSTDRNQTPVLNRMQLNYDVLCGIRPEIEVRYMPDRQYVLEGRKSQDDDYVNMVSKVDISEIQTLDAQASALYTKQINEFLLANSDILIKGRFMDTKGYTFECGSKAVRSSAFVSGKKMGVVVWNASNEETASYKIAAKGWKEAYLLCPEGDCEAAVGCAEKQIAPQSLQLVVFTK